MKIHSGNILLKKYSLLILSVLLFLFAFIYGKINNSRSSVAKEVRSAEKYIHQQQKDFDNFLKDTSRVNKLLDQNETLEEFKVFASKPYGIFLYTENKDGISSMKFWNDQLISPSTDLLAAEDGEYFSKQSNGWYFTIKKTLSDDSIAGKLITYAMIPVFSDFFIITDYLPQEFVYDKSAGKRVQFSDSETKFPVKSDSGQILFYLKKKASGSVTQSSPVTIFLKLSAIFILFLFIHLQAESVSKRKGPWKAIAFLAFVLLLMRLLTYYFPLIINQREFELFNPVIYGSNFIQRSLGDLLVNSVLFSWIILFAWSRLEKMNYSVKTFSTVKKWGIGILSIYFLFFSTLILAGVIRSLVADSKISFDVTDFFSLNVYTVIGFVVLAFLSLSYYYLSRILFSYIFSLFAGKNIQIYFAISVAALAFFSLRPGHPDILFHMLVLCWLLLYTWMANQNELVIKQVRINVAGILFWIFVFSVSISVIMLAENKKVEWEKRKRLADKLVMQTDPSSERLMSIAIQYIDNDFLSDNFSRFNNEDQGKLLRDSIINDNYSGYLNKYDTRLYIYDKNDKGIFNEDPISYEALNTILNVQSKPVESIDGLYYYETSNDRFNYITRRYVRDTANNKLGSFFIVSNPKNFIRDEMFPELFRQFKRKEPENSPIYSFAVYVNRILISPPGNYPFAIWLNADEIPNEGFHHRTQRDFDELWYRTGNEKVVIIARKQETLIETITLFSYIFCSFLFLVAFVRLLSFLLKTTFNRKQFRKILQLNIRTQVHSTIIFISILSFVIIGFATISFFISRYNRNNSDKLSRTMKIMVNEMQKKLSDQSTFDDVIKIYDSVSNTGLQKLVNEVSDIHGVDVNVYDLEGNLQVSTEANVYSKGVLSKKMDPSAFYHLSRLRQVQHAQEEKIGNFTFLSIYSPVRDESGKVYAYINIPYFTSKPELRKEISNFLVTIINLNAFIFLIAGLIALFITNRITSSFSLISDKMKEVNLGKMNEQITWNREDEIGVLVKEYNKMVTKLGESATALAKSEREGAWREMARQVAHEIKNPLTPMKLSIQYLQNAINNNQANVKELSGNVANTLVEQIDHLSKIAADFSQFANIGNTHVELFDLHEVIGSLKDLYQHNPKISIVWLPVNEQVIIKADKTQMNRLFTNLLANAVEACHNKEKCEIVIDEWVNDNKIRISIKDNGEGIPNEMQENIFIPNFTTKSSGTGLGLAMCKGIVEQAKGKIWFETQQGKGTTFFIELILSDK